MKGSHVVYRWLLLAQRELTAQGKGDAPHAIGIADALDAAGGALTPAERAALHANDTPGIQAELEPETVEFLQKWV